MKALATGAAGGLLGMALLTPWTVGTLATLANARQDQATLVAAATAPVAPAIVIPGLAVPAPSRAAATAALVTQIRHAAGRGGVLVEGFETIAGPDPLVRVRVRLSGSEGAVLALIDAIESGTPLVRLARWRIDARAGAVQLTAEVVAPWG